MTTTPRTRPSRARAAALKAAGEKPGSGEESAPEAAPEPGAEPQPEAPAETADEAWERLTAPLDTAAPVILTPAMIAESDAYRNEMRAGWTTDRQAVDRWYAEAFERTFGPLDAWLAKPAFPVPAGAEGDLEPLP